MEIFLQMQFMENCEDPISKVSESRTISTDVMASDDASTGAVPPEKLENQNGTVDQPNVTGFAFANSVMKTNVKEGNGGTSLSLIDHSRAGLTAAQKNSQLVQTAPSPRDVASNTLVAENQLVSMGVMTPTLLPNSTPGLDNSHLVLEQRRDTLLNEESMVNKSKSKKRSKHPSQDAGADRDVHKSKEKIRWKDVWVAQLIHIRGRMHSVFTNPQRQRVDLWQIVEREMTNTCFGFDKDSEACRKKWLRVYKEYKDDLHLSNKEETQKCRFYDLVDFYVGSRANNNNICNASFHPDVLPISAEPAHVINEVSVKPEDGGAIMLLPNPDVMKTPNMKKPHASKRPRITEKPLIIEKSQSTQESAETATPTKKVSANAESSSVHTMLTELVTIGKEMLQTTREYEKEKLSVLHSMKDMLGRIAKKL